MPAAFAHCLMVKKALDLLLNKPAGHPYIGVMGQQNQFVIMGAVSPDYPYLTDPILSGMLKTYHNWADRMHYEGTDKFIMEGIARLGSIADKKGDEFKIKLSWLLGYISHVIADSYVHPVINCIVNGPYIFTHAEHAKCEMIQDVFIFKRESETEILDSNPSNGEFGFLGILDDCLVADPAAQKRVLDPNIAVFWSDLLKFAHPQAIDHFSDIVPGTWHDNYKKRLNLVADPKAIFKQACGIAGVAVYKRSSEITADEQAKYINQVPLPDGKILSYPQVFDNAVDKIIKAWQLLFTDIERNTADNVKKIVRDWDLDTGVDGSDITLWSGGSPL